MNQKGFANIVLIVLVVVLVSVVGYFTLIKKQEPVTQQTTTTPPPATTQTPTPRAATPTPIDETANWKTYHNEKYGFEAKYPANFKVREDVNTYPDPLNERPNTTSYYIFVQFSSPINESFQVAVYAVPAGTSLDKAVYFAKSGVENLRVKAQTDFTVSGVPSRKIKAEQLSFSEGEGNTTFDPPRPYEEVFFVRGTQSYHIQITCGVISTDAFPGAADFCINKQDQFLDKIVSTFKFTK